ncbi:1901_t:CDS:1, partial [Dentiscutata heterogama]
ILIDDLYDTDFHNTPTSEFQDILQVSDDNAATSTATTSNSNITFNIPVTSVTPIISNKKKKFKSKSPALLYFSQKTIDNKI